MWVCIDLSVCLCIHVRASCLPQHSATLRIGQKDGQINSIYAAGGSGCTMGVTGANVDATSVTMETYGDQITAWISLDNNQSPIWLPLQTPVQL